VKSLLRDSILHVFRSGLSSIRLGIRTYIVNFRSIASANRIKTYKPLQSLSELAGSHLVFAEQLFVIRIPLKLAVRVDRVYDNGRCLTLLELKTRLTREIYPADVIELSAQRLAMQHSTKREVADYAYVLLLHPFLRTQTLRQVKLFSEETVVAMARRRQRLLDGLTAPTMTTVHTRCNRCEYRYECKSLDVEPK